MARARGVRKRPLLAGALPCCGGVIGGVEIGRYYKLFKINVLSAIMAGFVSAIIHFRHIQRRPEKPLQTRVFLL